MKHSRPLLEYSLSPLGYSCNVGQKTVNIHGNPCQHFWHQSSDCIFFCAKQFVFWLFMTVFSYSCSTLVSFTRRARRIEIGELLEATPPSLPAVIFDVMDSGLPKQGWRTLNLSCVFVMASWVDHCMVSYYFFWWRAVVGALFFSWLIFFFVGPGV